MSLAPTKQTYTALNARAREAVGGARGHSPKANERTPAPRVSRRLPQKGQTGLAWKVEQTMALR